MPYQSIKFNQGLNQKEGAPINSPYDMEDCYISPFDQVRAWKNGSNGRALTEKWVPRNKPFFYFNGRWFDKATHDAAFKFRNRAYLSKIEGSGDTAEFYTGQVVDGISDADTFYDKRYLTNELAPVFPAYSSYALESNNSTASAFGEVSTGLAGYGTSDDGIVGITNQRAVDFIFVPLDRYGQAGPWFFSTVLIDNDTSGGNVTQKGSGTDILTATVTFNLGLIIGDFTDQSSILTENVYDKVAIYRTVEYDLEGFTQDGSGAAEFSPGGYFLDAITGEKRYVVKSYWPYDIQKEASAISDQLGPSIDRNRNHWFNGINKQTTNLAARTSYMDRGVAIYGNVFIPTKRAIVSHYQNRAYATISATFATGPDTITRASGSYITDGFNVGDNVWVIGASNDANNKKLTVTTVTATVLTVEETLTAEGPTADVIVFNAPQTVPVYKYVKDDNTVVVTAAGEDNLGDAAPRSINAYHKSVVPYNSNEDGLRMYVKHSIPITATDTVADTVSIQGDWTEFFERGIVNSSNPPQFKLSGTSASDGTYTSDYSSATTEVNQGNGGTLLIDSTAKTFTRAIGSFVTDGFAIGTRFAFAAFSPNLGYYTVASVTATTITVNETVSRDENYTGGALYAMQGVSVTFGSGVTTIPVAEDITTAESTGTLDFYILWEDLSVDVDGRYKSEKQVSGEFYTFSGVLRDDFDFFDATDYESAEILADVPTGANGIEQKSRFYFSAVNAPWEITLDGGSVPDSSEIIAITPSRIEEVEQLTSYQFYIFTADHVYVGQRVGTSVTLSSVEATIGCQRGEQDQPLVVPVKGGVAFWGTDDTLYYLTGRQLTKLSYPIDTLMPDVDDMAYDPKDDFLYVRTTGSNGIYVYDFNRNMWIGQMRISGSFEEHQAEVSVDGTIDDTTIVGDQVGPEIFTGDEMTLDMNDFDVYAETGLAPGMRLDIQKKVISPPSTTSIAVVEVPTSYDAGDSWTVISGAILSGDVSFGANDSIIVEVDTLPPGLTPYNFELDIRLKIKGLSEDSATTASSLTVNAMEYEPTTKNMVFIWNRGSQLELVMFEERDDSGSVRNFPEIRTQEFDTVFTRNAKEIRVNFDGVLYSQTGVSLTAGLSTFTESGVGDDINGGLDVPAVILLPGAGIDVDGNACDLNTQIASESAGTVTLATPIGTTVGSANIQWRRPAEIRFYLNDDSSLRTRQIGDIPIIPNRPYFIKKHDGHRLRVEVQDFDTLREILIFLEDTLTAD